MVKDGAAYLTPDERAAIVFLVNPLDRASDDLARTDSVVDIVAASIEGERRKLTVLPLLFASRR